MTGKTIAHYQVGEKIGAGGMGEVYRARDTKLSRDVALKVLPQEFAKDPDRMARFKREAQVLASLNHPNIAGVYGFEQEGDSHALVLELVVGPTLAERIAQGPLPLEEALQIARQIAEALEAAHEQGVIHRDLKPANIKIREDGQVKVLDFGLAKALEGGDSEADVSNSPTLSIAATKAGIILGTAAYMAPEQARGQKADRRADIWSFGVVLWEMLVGKQPFTAKTISDVLARVLTIEPEWDSLPEEVPLPLRKLLRRCLMKDRKQRLQAIGEARIAIAEFQANPQASVMISPAAVEEQPARKRNLRWALAAGVFAIATLVLAILLADYSSQEGRVIRAAIPVPAGLTFHIASSRPGPVKVSPNGTMLAFSTIDEEAKVMLYVRSLDDDEAHLLSGTEGAAYPFWSPDSTYIGFFAAGKLKKIAAGGGPPLTLCDAFNGKGGTWNRDGTILFAPSHDTVIHRVSEAGGQPAQVTEFKREREDNSHRQPFFLPDGDHFLYLARIDQEQQGHAIMVRSLSEGTEKELLRAETAAEYASGHLLFLREGTLMARPFDPGSLEFVSNAFPLAENITTLAAGAATGVFSASTDGILVYQEGARTTGMELQWLDPKGNKTGVLGDQVTYNDVRLSPDGQSAAVTLISSGAVGSGFFDVWLYDLRRGIRSRFTFSAAHETDPVWSPDSRTIYFRSSRTGGGDIYRKATTGAGDAEQVLAMEGEQWPESVSADGRYLSFQSSTPRSTASGEKSTGTDIWVLPLTGAEKPFPILEMEFNEFGSAFSPSGRWMAYSSDESGATEVYVTPFPNPTRKWQVSTQGGAQPHWRKDGKEIVYITLSGRVMAAEVSSRGDTLEVGKVQPLFQTKAQNRFLQRIAASSDHKRFLAVTSSGEQPTAPITLVVNWTAELKK